MASEAEYDVYNTPRIGAIQFGNFVAAEAKERETILRGEKFARRGPRARAYFAREQIGSYLLSPVRKLGSIEVAIAEAKAESENPALSDTKKADALASLDALRGFLAMANSLALGGKDLIAADDEKQGVDVGGVFVGGLPLACLIRSYDKNKNERIGGMFLNSQKGAGLGTKDTTKAKRQKAGETVALLVLKRLIDEYSDLGIPYPKDALHVYLRAQHNFVAPPHYATKLAHLEADGRAIGAIWASLNPPSDFDPASATFHD